MEGKPVQGGGDYPGLCSHAPGFRTPVLSLPEDVTLDKSLCPKALVCGPEVVTAPHSVAVGVEVANTAKALRASPCEWL